MGGNRDGTIRKRPVAIPKQHSPFVAWSRQVPLRNVDATACSAPAERQIGGWTRTPNRGRSIRAVLRAALNDTVAWKLLDRNPAQHVRAPRPERAGVVTLSPEQAKKLLGLGTAKAHWQHPLISVALAVGLRLGEALGPRLEKCGPGKQDTANGTGSALVCRFKGVRDLDPEAEHLWETATVH